MTLHTYSHPDRVVSTGELHLDNGNIVSDGAGNLSAVSFSGSFRALPQSGKAQIVSNNTTIPTAGYGLVRVTTTVNSIATGVILESGVKPGQMVTVIHEGDNPITFAPAKKSNVADGERNTIEGLSARTFYWNSGTKLWYGSH